jgi:Bacterial archaeo-eukaryotic release factor family 10
MRNSLAPDSITLSLEEIRELAAVWAEQGSALSFYFQPPEPSELSHRGEPVLAKQELQQKLQNLQGVGRAHRDDIHRILESIATLREDRPRRTKIIFACSPQNFWREYDIPGDFGIRLDAGSSFTLAPLIAQQQQRRRYCIALADRNRARLFLLTGREITEHSQVLDEEKDKIRTTGTGANNNLERKQEEKVRRHFAFLSDHLLHFFEHGDYDALLIGCRDDMWSDIEATLHSSVKRILAGRFLVDPGIASPQEVAEKAQAFITDNDRRDEEALVARVSGSALSDGLGAIGLDAVIRSLEQGEVRTLLCQSSEHPSLPNGAAIVPRNASLCPNCAHLDSAPSHACTLCGAQMHRFERAEEALLRHALGRSIEIRMLSYAKLPPPDGLAAWLRFVASRNTAQALAS